jgi:hypothetical protein
MISTSELWLRVTEELRARRVDWLGDFSTHYRKVATVDFVGEYAKSSLQFLLQQYARFCAA